MFLSWAINMTGSIHMIDGMIDAKQMKVILVENNEKTNLLIVLTMKMMALNLHGRYGYL